MTRRPPTSLHLAGHEFFEEKHPNPRQIPTSFSVELWRLHSTSASCPSSITNRSPLRFPHPSLGIIHSPTFIKCITLLNLIEQQFVSFHPKLPSHQP
jgi:hypothetical protein